MSHYEPMRAFTTTAVVLAAIFSPRGAAAEEDPLRPSIGVQIASVADVINEERELPSGTGKPIRVPTTKGVVVFGVASHGPAASVLQPLDLIDRVGRVAVDDQEAFLEAIGSLKVGVPARFSLRRFDGRYKRTIVQVTPQTWGSVVRAAMVEVELPGTGLIRHSHREAPEHAGPTGVDVSYTTNGAGECEAWINIRLQTTEWLFVNRWTFEVDSTEHELAATLGEVSREVVINEPLREWEYRRADADVAGLLAALEKAESVKVTYHGKDYYQTHELETDNLRRIRESLAAAHLDGWESP
jgi:hypothetical protein